MGRPVARSWAGTRCSGRKLEHFDVHGGGFVATARDAAAVARPMNRIRFRAAVYGSTRTCTPILELHGLQDLGLKLHEMSVQRRWNEMAALVPDDVPRIFVAYGTYNEVVSTIEARHGGAADAIELKFPQGPPGGLMCELVADIRRIPHAFQDFAANRDVALKSLWCPFQKIGNCGMIAPSRPLSLQDPAWPLARLVHKRIAPPGRPRAIDRLDP